MTLDSDDVTEAIVIDEREVTGVAKPRLPAIASESFPNTVSLEIVRPIVRRSLEQAAEDD
jgi:hypothetical protein